MFTRVLRGCFFCINKMPKGRLSVLRSLGSLIVSSRLSAEPCHGCMEDMLAVGTPVAVFFGWRFLKRFPIHSFEEGA